MIRLGDNVYRTLLFHGNWLGAAAAAAAVPAGRGVGSARPGRVEEQLACIFAELDSEVVDFGKRLVVHGLCCESTPAQGWAVF